MRISRESGISISLALLHLKRTIDNGLNGTDKPEQRESIEKAKISGCEKEYNKY